MKKIIALLALCLTVGALAACGGDTATETDTMAATETDTVAATDTDTVASTETDTVADTESATEADTDSATETPTETPTEAETTTETATDAETEAETDATPVANTYHFTVLYGDTNLPAEGVQVQLCRGEDFCLMPYATDAEGKVGYSLSSFEYGVYDVHIMEDSLPEGYTFDNTAVKTSADVYEYTLTLTKE